MSFLCHYCLLYLHHSSPSCTVYFFMLQLVVGHALHLFNLLILSIFIYQALSCHCVLPLVLQSCSSNLMLLLYTSALSVILFVLQFGTLSATLGVGSSLVVASDLFSYIFVMTLFSISISVMTWAYYYIYSELDFRRFICLLLLFLISMFGLVFAADLLRLFVAWDLLGFTSFFLVIFYRSRTALAGGLLTGLTSRVGDVFLLGLLGFCTYSSVGPASWAVYLLLVVSFTKSAQIPFSSWLPAAILAPTPVSALVHSSTLVTAGVYLLFRFCPLSSSLLVHVGTFTTLVAGLAAALECDSKKIIALSTLRQLGLIVTSLGFGARVHCFAHLNTHAAFKALLFLAIGTYIHRGYGSQEARSVVSLHSSSPLTIVIFVTASISLCGLVFLSGWVTKEAILESRFNILVSLSSLLFFYLGIGLTLIYSLRLVYSLFFITRSTSGLTPTFSCSRLTRFPMYWLLSLSVIQGFVFDLKCFGTPTFLSWEDKIVVYGVMLFSVFLRLRLIACSAASPSPFECLGLATSFLRRASVSVRAIQFTEVSAFQGGGLACLVSLLAPLRFGTLFLTKLTLLLSFTWVVL